MKKRILSLLLALCLLCGMLPQLISGTYAATIGDYAFYGSRLTSVTIPYGVSAIGNEIFYGCNRLSSVNIPDSVKTIGTQAFYGCTRLSSVTLPNSVSTIGESTKSISCKFLRPYGL